MVENQGGTRVLHRGLTAEQLTLKKGNDMKDAQQQHDEDMTSAKPVSRRKLKKLLAEASYDPIANAMERHPGLTEEKAEAMAKAFGF